MSAMMADTPKQNANPTILAVDKRSERPALLYPELRAISMSVTAATDDIIDSSSLFNHDSTDRSPEDLAILQALTDASVATKGQSTSLLRNLGLNIPITPGVQPFDEPPRFHPLGTSHYHNSSIDNDDDSKEKNRQLLQQEVVHENEIFEIIRNIQDPEHPLTLEQLAVVSREQVKVVHRNHTVVVHVRFTPTIPHCSMATHIGLCLKVKLNRSLPKRYRTRVSIEPGTHASENAINKQLADKERVCAALENKHLLGIVNKCILNGMTGNMS